MELKQEIIKLLNSACEDKGTAKNITEGIMVLLEGRKCESGESGCVVVGDLYTLNQKCAKLIQACEGLENGNHNYWAEYRNKYPEDFK